MRSLWITGHGIWRRAPHSWTETKGQFSCGILWLLTRNRSCTIIINIQLNGWMQMKLPGRWPLSKWWSQYGGQLLKSFIIHFSDLINPSHWHDTNILPGRQKSPCHMLTEMCCCHWWIFFIDLLSSETGYFNCSSEWPISTLITIRQIPVTLEPSRMPFLMPWVNVLLIFIFTPRRDCWDPIPGTAEIQSQLCRP